MKSRPDNLPDNLNQNLSFFRRWSKTYDFPLFQFWMRGFQRPVLEEVDFSSKGKLLDVSCGTGQLLKALERKNGEKKLQLVGVDLSPEMLAKARERVSAAVTLMPGNVHALPFASNSFDYVVSTEAFHHYGDQQKALREMMRVAKKGGIVMIVDINFFFHGIHWLFEHLEPGCQKVNSRKEMLRLFQEAGLQNIQQRRSFLFAVVTKGKKRMKERLSRAYQRQPSGSPI
ncbi:MAG: methyltransferase domain-containing protein [Nanoarchaeota archaeon]